MTHRKAKTIPALTSALEAVANLCEDAFSKLDSTSGREALMAHFEIERRHVNEKSAGFYRSYLPLRAHMVALLADTYRRFFKLGLAHPSQTEGDPGNWAWIQLQPAVHAALGWMRDWYVLACDGENRRLRRIASFAYVPGGTVSTPIPTSLAPLPPPTSWRAPAWLYGVSIALFGIGFLKEQHVPARDSEEKLGEAHTRLLLKGARKVFLWELGAAIETVRNEEIAAAGAVPAEMAGGQGGQTNKPEHWLKGAEGLVRKVDLSQYMHNLTEKQQLAFSLEFEYELGLAEVASRMGIDRKTAYEHIEAAKRKIDQARSNEKSKAHRPKSEDE